MIPRYPECLSSGSDGRQPLFVPDYDPAENMGLGVQHRNARWQRLGSQEGACTARGLMPICGSVGLTWLDWKSLCRRSLLRRVYGGAQEPPLAKALGLLPLDTTKDFAVSDLGIAQMQHYPGPTSVRFTS